MQTSLDRRPRGRAGLALWLAAVWVAISIAIGSTALASPQTTSGPNDPNSLIQR